MNPEDTAKPVDPKREASAQPQPKAQSDQLDSESSEQLNALAKALMVNVLWSNMGLFDEKKK